MRDAFNKKITELASKDSDVLLLTGDIGFQVFDEFREKFGERFMNIGVAESNMVGMSAGLSLIKKKPFIYTIIPF